MATIVYCSSRPAAAELGGTILFRDGVTREEFPTIAAAQDRLMRGGVALIILDKNLSGIDTFLRNLRKSPVLKKVSAAVYSRDEFDPDEIEFLTAGANTILRCPPIEEFDRKVSNLVKVQARKETRIPVQLRIEAIAGFGSTIPVVALNVSLSGMLVESSYDIGVGDEIQVACQLTDTSPHPFRALGKVMRRTPRGHYGVRFVEIQEGEGDLRRLLEGD